MAKRIIPISSGKGGVGKTSFAINLSLALAVHGRTVLMDLDTGTSSVRTVIRTPVRRDLYHFFKRQIPLAECTTSLRPELDPEGRFSNFGFVASPQYLVDEICNMNQAFRNRLIDGINALNADFVILDLKAGVDPMVLDFLPHSNSGILVFTPNHPAATLAAVNVIKAIMFRKLRALFYRGSSVFKRFPQGQLEFTKVKALIDQAEDAYDPRIQNLDMLLHNLRLEFKGHPVLRLIENILTFFDIHVVLNRFNGVNQSYAKVLKPFASRIQKYLSHRITVQNLGWIVESQRYHQANLDGIPYLLQQMTPEQPRLKKEKKSAVEAQLAELYAMTGRRKSTVEREPTPTESNSTIETQDTKGVLLNQLHTLEKMYAGDGDHVERQNLEHIVAGIQYLLERSMVAELGDQRLYKPGETVPLFPKASVSTS